jgi:hypothetical protein
MVKALLVGSGCFPLLGFSGCLVGPPVAHSVGGLVCYWTFPVILIVGGILLWFGVKGQQRDEERERQRAEPRDPDGGSGR